MYRLVTRMTSQQLYVDVQFATVISLLFISPLYYRRHLWRPLWKNVVMLLQCLPLHYITNLNLCLNFSVVHSVGDEDCKREHTTRPFRILSPFFCCDKDTMCCTWRVKRSRVYLSVEARPCYLREIKNCKWRCSRQWTLVSWRCSATAFVSGS